MCEVWQGRPYCHHPARNLLLSCGGQLGENLFQWIVDAMGNIKGRRVRCYTYEDTLYNNLERPSSSLRVDDIPRMIRFCGWDLPSKLHRRSFLVDSC